MTSIDRHAAAPRRPEQPQATTTAPPGSGPRRQSAAGRPAQVDSVPAGAEPPEVP